MHWKLVTQCKSGLLRLAGSIEIDFWAASIFSKRSDGSSSSAPRGRNFTTVVVISKTDLKFWVKNFWRSVLEKSQKIREFSSAVPHATFGSVINSPTNGCLCSFFCIKNFLVWIWLIFCFRLWIFEFKFSPCPWTVSVLDYLMIVY